MASAAGAVTWVTAALGSLAAAATSARHILGFDRTWTVRALAVERIKALIALFELRQIDDIQLVQEVAQIVDREAADWQHTVHSVHHGDVEDKDSRRS